MESTDPVGRGSPPRQIALRAAKTASAAGSFSAIRLTTAYTRATVPELIMVAPRRCAWHAGPRVRLPDMPPRAAVGRRQLVLQRLRRGAGRSTGCPSSSPERGRRTLTGQACPLCGAPTRRTADVIDELVEAVIHEGGSIHHVRADTRLAMPSWPAGCASLRRRAQMGRERPGRRAALALGIWKGIGTSTVTMSLPE